MRRQRNLIGQIRNLVSEKIGDEPFETSDFDFLSASPSFLSKHAVGNGRYSEYFVRISRGKYKLKERI